VLSKKIGIDLGTSTVLVYVKGEGVVLNEPAVMATDEKGARVLAVGRAATELVGRGGKARSLRLVKDGSLLDYGVAGAMVQHLIGRVVGRQRIFRPDVMLSVPPLVTGVERRAMLEATMQAGAKTAYLIDKPMAAAIGARISVATNDGVVVVNLGAGSSEVAAIALGEMLAMESIRGGGAGLDRAIEVAVAQAQGLRLAAGEAERLKREIGVATVPPAEATISAAATGRDAREVAIAVSAIDVHRAIQESLQAIAAGVKRVVDQVPEERRASLQRNGIVLTGGGALLRGIAEFLTAQTGLPARVAADPQSCIAVGSGMALDNLQVIRRGQHYIA
jgi:rod shape-determining protein MreB and related proteins